MTESLYLLPLPEEEGDGRGKRRSFEQREHDLTVIASAYVKGRAVKEIVEMVKDGYKQIDLDIAVSEQAVRKDIEEIHIRWINSALIDFDAAKGRELAKLYELETTYWDAWERSRQERTKEESSDILTRLPLRWIR
jgi:hypothetical protein